MASHNQGRKMKNGIVYIAFVKIKRKKVERMKELQVSVTSVKQMHPKLHITLFTDKDPKIPGIDNVKIVNIDMARVKHKYLYHSPYQNTLYLDCDTKVVGPILESFRLMERFDIAAVQDHMRKDERKSKQYPDYAKIPDGFSEFGGGVLMFRKSPEVKNFFRVWQKNFDIWYKLTGEVRDQPCLRVSMWECSNLKIYVLPPEFNIRFKKYDNIVPRILHEHNIWRRTHEPRRINKQLRKT
jgi:hypothetical protein